jgi:hypothetical protein
MDGLFDDGFCKFDGVQLVRVQVRDADGYFPHQCHMCKGCGRVFVCGRELDVKGCEVLTEDRVLIE